MPELLKEGFLQVAANKNDLQIMFSKDRERMLQFTDWTDKDLQSIKAPTMLILGDNDVVKPEHAVEMFRKVPTARLMILPGDHGSYIGEVCSMKKGSKVPEMTVTVIEEFLSD